MSKSILVPTTQNRLNQEQKKMVQTIKKKEFLNINKKMSKAEGFGLDKVETWKVKTYYQMKEEQDGYIYFGDINNLSIANENVGGKENRYLIDKQIKYMIRDMREVLKQNGIETYNLGKMGDEIYLYIPGKLEEEKASNINQKLNQIKQGILTISFGYTNDFSQGLENANQIAEEKMMIEKEKRKNRQIKSVFGINEETIQKEEKELEFIIEKMIQMAITQVFEKLRLRALELNQGQKDSIERTFREAIQVSSRNIEEIQKRIEQDYNQSKEVKKSGLYEQINQIEAKVMNTQGLELTKEELQQYVLSEILKNSSIKGIIKEEYYDKIGVDKELNAWNTPLAKNRFMNEIKNTQLLVVDISGVKYVNDNYGHNQTDKEIGNIITNLKKILEEENLPIKNIVMSDISKYIIALPKEHEKVEKVKEKMKQYERVEKAKGSKLFTIIEVQDLYTKESSNNKYYQNRGRGKLKNKIAKKKYMKNLRNVAKGKAEEKIGQMKQEKKASSAVFKEYVIQNLVNMRKNPIFKQYLVIQEKKGKSQETVIEQIYTKGLHTLFQGNHQITSNQKEKGSIPKEEIKKPELGS